tara:strand:- start:7682 stop:8050 length:369 start_codon:yes stop_codon:yes gene_type:complete
LTAEQENKPPILKTLKKRSDFVAANAVNQKWISPSVIVQILKQEDPDTINVGYTVTKKVGNAVTRNRIKRRLRAAVTAVVLKHAQAGYAYILIGRKETETIDFDKLCSDLKWCLKRLDVLKP